MCFIILRYDHQSHHRFTERYLRDKENWVLQELFEFDLRLTSTEYNTDVHTYDVHVMCIPTYCFVHFSLTL